MKKSFMLLVSSLMIVLLSGCLYPNEKLVKNQVAYKDQLAAVQTAVNQYRTDSEGLLPIKTRDMNTPIYQKYPIDFNKLVPKYMQEPPGTAFENGGVFSYVLVDVETNPTVKLIDLRIAEQIRDIKIRMKAYKYPPFKEMIAKGIFTIDYKKIGYEEEPYVISPFSGKNLPLVINHKGEVFVDYSMDLYDRLQKYKRTYKPGEDILPLLVQDSDFVPAYSLPYTIDSKKNEPVFLVH
ncbi:hypothetical protein ACFOU2_04155 [Bacillus songklensis]|uniref:ABC transporter periplasmic binding protein yphF n=1 Tax=Bacillus songklensis TaxID=1069116 RepID=A0ABV8B0H3_9BACI